MPSPAVAPLALRRATVSDAAILAALGGRTFREAFAPDNRAEDVAAYIAATYSAEYQRRELADPAVTVLVAERGEATVGYIMLRSGPAPSCVTGGAPIEIARLYVVREELGRGVGRCLMRDALAVARAQGARTAWLGVWQRNARALAFYRKWSFSVVGTQRFLLGADVQADWVMARDTVAADA